jgi:hypothetical protein
MSKCFRSLLLVKYEYVQLAFWDEIKAYCIALEAILYSIEANAVEGEVLSSKLMKYSFFILLFLELRVGFKFFTWS